MPKYIEQDKLQEAIRKATKTLKVCVPTTGLDKMHNRFTTEEISYVDPKELLDALKEQRPADCL